MNGTPIMIERRDTRPWIFKPEYGWSHIKKDFSYLVGHGWTRTYALLWAIDINLFPNGRYAA